MAQTGLRVSEVVGLRTGDVELGTGPHVRCRGKGRKERVTPLTTHTASALRTWLREGHRGPQRPLFPNSTGPQLSRDAAALVLARHARTATPVCPFLAHNHLTPPAPRHPTHTALPHTLPP